MQLPEHPRHRRLLPPPQGMPAQQLTVVDLEDSARPPTSTGRRARRLRAGQGRCSSRAPTAPMPTRQRAVTLRLPRHAGAAVLPGGGTRLLPGRAGVRGSRRSELPGSRQPNAEVARFRRGRRRNSQDGMPSSATSARFGLPSPFLLPDPDARPRPPAAGGAHALPLGACRGGVSTQISLTPCAPNSRSTANSRVRAGDGVVGQARRCTTRCERLRARRCGSRPRCGRHWRRARRGRSGSPWRPSACTLAYARERAVRLERALRRAGRARPAASRPRRRSPAGGLDLRERDRPRAQQHRRAAAAQSTMVDAPRMPTSQAPPSSTGTRIVPNSPSTCCAPVGLTRPKRLALGPATTGTPCSAQASSSAWRHRMRRAAQADGAVPPRPRRRRPLPGWRVTISVSGPGQKACTSFCANSGSGCAKRESASAPLVPAATCTISGCGRPAGPWPRRSGPRPRRCWRRRAADRRARARSCSARSSLTCMCSGRSATSSRNRVPPSAAWNRPDLSVTRAGEAALQVAEELALHQLAGNGAAVDRDEGAPGAGRCGGSGARPAPCRCRTAGDVHRRLAAGEAARSWRAAGACCRARRAGRRRRSWRGSPSPRSFRAASTSLRSAPTGPPAWRRSRRRRP